MPIFLIKNKKLFQVKEVKFDFEKDLQKLTVEKKTTWRKLTQQKR